MRGSANTLLASTIATPPLVTVAPRPAGVPTVLHESAIGNSWLSTTVGSGARNSEDYSLTAEMATTSLRGSPLESSLVFFWITRMRTGVSRRNSTTWPTDVALSP